MNPRRVLLPCGCAVLVDHPKGDRLVVCEGGGFSIPEGEHGLDRERLDVCPGGVKYAVHAEPTETVIDSVRALRRAS